MQYLTPLAVPTNTTHDANMLTCAYPSLFSLSLCHSLLNSFSEVLPDLLHPSPEKQLAYTPPKRTVTKVSLDGGATSSKTAESVPGSYHPHPYTTTVISPWNNNNNISGRRPDSTSSSDSNGNECRMRNSNWPTATATAPEHPFAQRAQLHYHQRQRQHMQNHQSAGRATAANDNNDVAITTSRMSGGGVTLSPGSLTASQELNLGNDHANNNNIGPHSRFNRAESADRLMLREYDHLRQRHSRIRAQYKKMSTPTFSTGYVSPHAHHRERSECSLDESFRKILAKADNSISQAESILSSLKVERDEITATEKSEEDSEELASLGSDIEGNIRRLEKTQAKINAALTTFRTVQALNETHGASAIVNQQNQQQQLVKGRRAMRQFSNHRGFAANESNSYSSLPAMARFETLPSKMELARTPMSSDRPGETAEKSRTAPAKLEGNGVAIQNRFHASSVTGKMSFVSTVALQYINFNTG